MDLPFHRYLLWLHLIGTEKERILKHLDEISFPEPDLPLLLEYRKLAEQTPMSAMTQRRVSRAEYSIQDNAFFAKFGLGEIHAQHCKIPLPPSTVRSLQDIKHIIDNPMARVAVDCCLIINLRFEEIRQLIQFTHGFEVTDFGFQLYSKVYFDHENQTKHTWREYLKLLAADAYSYVRYLAALTQPRDEVLHLIGLPTKPAFSEFLKKVLNKSEYKFSYYSGQNTDEGDASARKWAKLGMDAGVKYEKFSAADVTDFSAVLQTEFTFVEENIPNITGEMLADIKIPDPNAEQNKVSAPPVLHPDPEP